MWLAAAVVAAAWGAVYCFARWTVFFVLLPIHEDVRITYVAAEAGLRYGWSTIYDLATLRALSTSFPASQHHIDSSATYINPPLWAWLFAPLTLFSEPVAYLLWSLVSLAALVWAWYIAAPYAGLAKLTLLLVAVAMWPVLLSFYFGQPTIVMLGLVGTAWWLCTRDRPLAAGAALALATALKPQVVFLVPLALLVSGRYRVVIGAAAAGVALTVATIITLGPTGLMSWWQALKLVQADPAHAYYTLAFLFGFGPVTYALWAVQGVTAMLIARWRRTELEIVFAAGIIGSVAGAFHLHQADYSMLILAAWLVLRTSPPLWHRMWLLVGIATMQSVTLGPPTLELLWDAGWLGILAASSFRRRTAPAIA
jgi:Glycosyltransferase family 87